MLTQTSVAIVVAAGSLIAAIAFLGSLALAGIRRSRGATVSPRMTALVTFLGGVAIGMMLLVGGANVVLAAPLVGLVVVLGVVLLGRGRVREAGWLLAGATAPWTVLWGVYLAAIYLRLNAFDFFRTWLGFLAGALPMLFGLIIALARRLPAAGGQTAGNAKGPGGRTMGDVGRVVLAPALVGPFGLPEVALLVALVATWFVVGLLLPAAIPEPIRLGILTVIGAVIGAEAWIRSLPSPARQAFEAMSWLGEWEIAKVRAQTGAGVPTTAAAARSWLLAHPERPDERWIRVEVLLLAGRVDEAVAVADRMPDSTPQERVDRAVAIDLADWFAGRDGQLEAVATAVGDLAPEDEEGRLRVDVAIAMANVRRRMAEGIDLVDAGAPLRKVRQRLGSRADGQVGRAMRCRLQRTLLVVGSAFAVGLLILDALLPAT
jgi:hypothetical protein